MRIGIICAMEEELESIINSFKVEYTTINNNNFTVHIAESKKSDLLSSSQELIFILCGIGKVNAAIHTQYLISQYKPDYIINVGVAGSLSENLNFGDVVIAKDLVQHDVNVTAFGMPLGQIPRMDVFAFSCDDKLLHRAGTICHQDYKIEIGRIASGDQFVDDKNHAISIYNEFNALACEMEGAAVAQVCYINQVPFIVVRALSDMAGRLDVATYSFKELKHMTASRSSYVVKQLLELL